MQRFHSLILTGAIVVTAPSCQEEEPGETRSLADGGQQQGLCPGCGGDAGLLPPTAADIARCAALDPSGCVGDAKCTTMFGLSYDKAQHCRAAGSIAVGCRALGQGCGGSYTRATDPSGGAWRMSDICLPPGWLHAPEEPQPALWIEDYPVCPSSQLEASCARLNAQTCALDTACYAVKAIKLDEFRRCKQGDWQYVGCTQDKGCNGLSSLAKDQSGGAWELPGVCLPLGWTVLANTETNIARHEWPACGF